MEERAKGRTPGACTYVRSVHRALFLVLVGGLATSGCLFPSCPSQPTGCADSAELSLMLPESSGSDFEFIVSGEDGTDAQDTRCLLASPDVSWDRPWLLDCKTGDFSVSVAPVLATEADCEPTPAPTGINVDCGASVKNLGTRLTVRVAGRPAKLRLALRDATNDYTPVDVAMSYATVKPDGPSCPGACSQASQALHWSALTTP